MTSAIQSALNAGGHVVLQAGTYTVSHTLTVPSGVEFSGQGEGVTTILVAASANVDPVVTTNGGSNITVAQMTINQDGESKVSTQNLAWYLLEARGGSNVIFQNIATRDPSTYSMVAVNESRFCFLNNNVLQDPAENGKYDQLDGIHVLNSSYGDVLDNYVDNSYDGATDGDDGIVAHADGGNVSNILYAGNVVRGGQNGAGMGIWTYNGTITGITVTQNEFWGELGIHSSDSGGSTKKLTNSSITTNNLHNNGSSTLAGILLGGTGLTVTGNELCSSGSVQVTGSANTVSGNGSYSGCSDAPTTQTPPPVIP
jgi:hypothetical protein